MESKRNTWIWIGTAVVIIAAAALVSAHNSAVSRSGTAGTAAITNQTYTSSRLGFSFTYPSNLKVAENEAGATLVHSIPFANSFCLAGGASPVPDFKDFNVSLQLENGSVADAAKKAAPEIPASDYSGASLKEIPGVILKADVGPYESYSVIEGFKGCGTITYFLTVTPGRILVIKSDVPYPFTAAGGAKGVAEKVLAVPGVIKPEDSVLILSQVIGSFKLL